MKIWEYRLSGNSITRYELDRVTDCPKNYCKYGRRAQRIPKEKVGRVILAAKKQGSWVYHTLYLLECNDELARQMYAAYFSKHLENIQKPFHNEAY